MSEFTPYSLPAGATSGAMAIADDGNVWVAAAAVSEPGQPQYVYQVGKTGSVSPQRTAVHAAFNDEGVRLSHVALQQQGGVVERVWVSSMDDHAVAYFQPGASTATSIDLGSHASPRGLLWDVSNQLIWVADEATGNMYAIDVTLEPPAPVSQKQVVFGSGISMLAMARGKIWATGYAESAIFSFDLAKLGQSGQGINRYSLNSDGADPFALQFASDGKRLWFTTVAYGYEALWKIDDVTLPGATTERIELLGMNSDPRSLAVDNSGFVWVAIANPITSSEQNPLNLTGQSVCEFYEGAFVGEKYPDRPNSFAPNSILYRGNITHPIDDFWVSDQANARVFDFVPPDSIDPLEGQDVDYSGSPTTGYVGKGQAFDHQISVKVTRQDTRALLRDRQIEVQITGTDVSFSDSSSVQTATIITGPGNGNPAGVALVPTIYASTAAQTGDSFLIKGYTRGQPNLPVAFFSGHIGSKPNVDGITPEDPENVFTRVNKRFPKTLDVHVSGADGVPIPVIFQIQSGSASFKEASYAPGDKTTTVHTDSSGKASATLYALDTAGPVVVHAYPDKSLWPGIRPAEFDWQVTPVPAHIQWASTYNPHPGFSDDGLWVKVLGAHGTPCPGETVQISILPPEESDEPSSYFVHSVTEQRLTDDQIIPGVNTDADGSVILDNHKSGGYALRFIATGKIYLQAVVLETSLNAAVQMYNVSPDFDA
ncbi:hypothetical protein [Burkholderia stabilis]|uniref:Vgb family protein n=1 Tax=Burkholderia stabilis TaxID=95485 RepID=UPI0011478804|nr:hypothetical protein [Burkholderia stabilis]GAU04407.1 hypothetical protein, NHL repeat [Burkholderia stabilis]